MFTIPKNSPTHPLTHSPASISGNARSAFSLIEVLISTVILLVIVVMVSMVFQQQSAAYQSGTDRVQGQAALRNALGMIVRDLSLAVDSKEYDSNKGLPENHFSSSEISFLALTGNGDESMDTGLEYITYSRRSGVVERKVEPYVLRREGGWSRQSGSVRTVSLNSSVSKIDSIKFEANGGSQTFPDTITITASHEGKSSAASIVGWSAGPDCNWGTDDDIYVGGKP